MGNGFLPESRSRHERRSTISGQAGSLSRRAPHEQGPNRVLTGLCKHTLTRGSDLRTVAGEGHCSNDSPLELAVFGGSGDPVSHSPAN